MENLRNNYSVEDDEEEGDEMEIERRQNQDDNGGTANPEFDEETEDMWANGDSLPSKAAKPPKPRKRIQNFDFKDSNYSEDFDEYEEMEDNEDDEDDEDINFQTKIQPLQNAYEENPISTPASDEEQSLPKKQNSHACFTSQSPTPETSNPPTPATTTATSSKKKKKNNNVWTKSTSRKGKKKSKTSNNVATDHTVLVPSIPRFQDKTDDSPEMKICLSKVYKAEKVELSDDRLSAGSTKGYRMVRATRGVKEGAWYFEIRVEKLGETGHTRLGWSTEKGDLQAPVGYDSNSFGYRDLDGSKVHKALREKYGEEGYNEGDVIGCYINLPEGEKYAPKPPHLVWYKGQRYAYAADGKEDPPKVVPGSEISFFKNGICQGVAFKDLFGGRYYPAASMYTLPHQPNCVVKFNFGPDFEVFPQDFGSRPTPRPMIDVPYHGLDAKVEVLAENGLSTQKKG